MLKEFKKFTFKGNVIDMTVGVVIGTAFGEIVSSLFSDIIMPPIGVLTGRVNFTKLAVTLQAAGNGKEAVTLNYRLFINSKIDFLIIAFVIFIAVKQINKLKKKEEDKPIKPTEDILLLREI